MTGTLYVIGVGPGDPELLTLKAVRIIKEINCLCVPKGKEEGRSLALSIVRKAVDLKGKEIIEAHFPMQKTARASGHTRELDEKWNIASREIVDRLTHGRDVAFITIGDPTIFSTFFYIYDRLLATISGLPLEIVPGVSSINASASVAQIPLGLGNGKIAVLPANYLDDLSAILQQFDTIVLMKVYKVLPEVKDILSHLGILHNAVYVSRAGMKDQSICRDLADLKPDDLDYFSMVIVKK
jgi:precorrin-2/cobalt-factor-2 C20-methyltransferase